MIIEMSNTEGRNAVSQHLPPISWIMPHAPSFRPPDGQRLWLEEPHPEWIGPGLATDKRAVLHSQPVEDDRDRPFLVEWDAVAVLDWRDDWVHVEFLQSDPPTRGWVRASSLSLAFPGRE